MSCVIYFVHNIHMVKTICIQKMLTSIDFLLSHYVAWDKQWFDRSVANFFTSGAGASKKIKIYEVTDVSVSSSEYSNKPDVIVRNDKASMSRDGSNNLTTCQTVNANISWASIRGLK
jgi:hypothetical protein